MAKIGVNFRAVCLCLSCRGCKQWQDGSYVPHCKRDCEGRPQCLPLVGCPGYWKEGEPHPEDEIPFY